jgi:hypothetical protein
LSLLSGLGVSWGVLLVLVWVVASDGFWEDLTEAHSHAGKPTFFAFASLAIFS